MGTATDRSFIGLMGTVRHQIESGGKPAAALPALLQELAALANAERAFLAVHRASGWRLLGSITIDGDQVPDAEGRLPEALLEAARTAAGDRFAAGSRDLPPAVAEAFAGLSRKGALLCRVRGERGASAFAYIENRFCPLEPFDAMGPQLDGVLDIIGLCLWASDLEERLASRDRDLAKAEALLAGVRAPASAGSLVPARPRGRNAANGSFKGDYNAIVTCSPRLYAIFNVIDKIAHTSAPVLITGESGTGKELVARAIHQNSPRAEKPFVPENCAALTETLLESELFGYVKGAFTGATAARKGLFEIANGGTLFLDEVGDMSPSLQKKLLRVLQEGVLRPVGGKDFIPIDVRIISATNRDLAEAFLKEQFREDLFYRLNVITIEVPPLRERAEDVPLLVDHFLRELAGPGGMPKQAAPEALALLSTYRWPGNVRQLQNEIQRLHALSGERIEVHDLSPKIRAQSEGTAGFSFAELELLPLAQAVESFEREFLRRALKRYAGNKTKLAKGLGVAKTSLYTKLARYGL